MVRSSLSVRILYPLSLSFSFPFHLLLCALTLSRLRELQPRIYRVVQPASRYRAQLFYFDSTRLDSTRRTNEKLFEIFDEWNDRAWKMNFVGVESL